MAIRTREQLVEEIIHLEIECSKIVEQAGGNIYGSDLFPKYLKLTRKIQKLQSQL
jgi:hypothetical protein